MRTLSIEIQRSELCTIRKGFAPWEYPILQAIHSIPSVIVKGEIDNDKPYPTSAATEFARLEQVYGRSEETGVSFVAQVYGNGSGGHVALGQKIRQFIADAKKRDARPPPPDVVFEVDDEDRITADDDIIDAGAETADVSAEAEVAHDPLVG